ncbi:MAG: SDR family oxidoreductase [Burkholderiaceae bacterium]|jgi:NADP-dependent 3-hydroxy acid dehydrogenase YdfG|nr:SDR family oxidoreductase [Burkholderiaceae bacterium]
MNLMQRGTALVTGASSGIGAAVAQALAADGWRVVCAARRVEKLRALAQAIGTAAQAITLDVADAVSTASLLERLPEDWRAIDLLVNNAGHDVGGRRRFDRGPIEDWAATVETNVTGMLRVTRALVPAMAERGRGHVVNIGSIAAFEVNPGGAAYVTSKAAVHGFSQALRADFKGKGVRVTEVVPGIVRTEFAETRWAGDTARAEEFYSKFPALLDPADIARAVVYAAQQPAHVTIAEMVVVTSA